MEIKIVRRRRKRYISVEGALAIANIEGRLPSGIARKVEEGRMVAPDRIRRLQRIARKLIGGIDNKNRHRELFFNRGMPFVRETGRERGWREDLVIFG